VGLKNSKENSSPSLSTSFRQRALICIGHEHA
jgi:hypothetical protein